MGVTTSKKEGISVGTASSSVCSACSNVLNSGTAGCFSPDHHMLCFCKTNKQTPWTRVSSEVLTTWKYGAVLWGFEPRIDYTSNVKGRLQPWCTGGRHFVVTHDSPNKILQRPYCLMTITENCLKQDTHIRLPYAYAGRLYAEPEPAGHYLKSAQVVGYRSGIALLQLNCTDNLMEFVAVHMKTSSILAIHKEETPTGKHYLCDCIISPDLGSFILKPNAMYVLNFCRGEFRNAMKVLSLKENRCPVLKSIFPNLAVRLFAAYDPRYCWSRAALGNYSRSGRDVLCVYDIKEDKVVLESGVGHYQTTHNIIFSPDGRYIASLILGRSIKDGLFNFPKVLVYSSDTLEVVHSIRTEFLAEVPTLSPAAIFPLFSDTGERMAVAYGEQGTFYQQVVGVHLYRVPTAFDLQSLCREVIRKRFDCQDVQRLPLPNQMKSFLAFKPYFE